MASALGHPGGGGGGARAEGAGEGTALFMSPPLQAAACGLADLASPGGGGGGSGGGDATRIKAKAATRAAGPAGRRNGGPRVV